MAASIDSPNTERNNGGIVEEKIDVYEDSDATYCQQGYTPSIWKCIVFSVLATLPCGMGLLFAYWFPHYTLKLVSHKCCLPEASYVLLKDCDNKWSVCRVHRLTAHNPSTYNQTCDNYDDDCSASDGELVTMLPSKEEAAFIKHRHLRYFYDPSKKLYAKLSGYDCGVRPSVIHQLDRGLLQGEQEGKLQIYGPNSIDVPVTPYHHLLMEEVLHPFYLFEFMTVVFWMADEYVYYAGAVLLITVVSVVLSLFQTRKHLKQLHDMVSHTSVVTVLRDDRVIDGVSSESLAPGDVLIIPSDGMSMPCDAALLTGNCIVNEAMLTGESMPVTKTPLPQDDGQVYTPDDCKRHTLFNGTEILQTRFFGSSKVLAVVVRTGFFTAKGSLVRSILFPKPFDRKMWRDTIKFVLILAIIAFLGILYTVAILKIHHYSNIKETFFRAFDVITIVVPPALPTALTIGTVYSLNRLKKQSIYCTSPQRVSLSGKIKLACFDKTGTLTEDSLDLLGVQACYSAKFAELVSEPRTDLPMGDIKFAMAACHSLTRINGVLRGDPLELKMFEALGWELEEPGEECTRFDTMIPTVIHATSMDKFYPSVELGILRQFTFSSELQRMSVLVKKLPSTDANQIEVYVKGAPEKIRQLCKPESVPPDFPTILGYYTKKGYRVLALAHRTMHLKFHKAERINRNEVERDLNMLGLLVMENRLKPETSPVIGVLHSANIRTVMVTGDNLLTAISVARDCGIVIPDHRVIVMEAAKSGNDVAIKYVATGDNFSPENSTKMAYSSINASSDFLEISFYGDVYNSTPFCLAIDGKSFELVTQYRQDLVARLMVCGAVFARMAPDQKAQLVTELQQLGYGVAMCGDGANDCGALKAAHAGISLSETEASVASPFTSKIPNISCVPKVIKEGRAALVTSFSIFKFMALYSITEFITVAFLYFIESNLGDFQYLFIDLILIFAFAFVMGFSGPSSRLVKQRPLGTLAGPAVFLSLAVHVTLITLTQVAIWYYLKSQSWYTPLVPTDGYNIECSENTALFQTANFQYIIIAIVLSTGPPYRKPLYTNYWFMLCLLILVPVCGYMLMAPPLWLKYFPPLMQLIQHPSVMFRYTILLLLGVHLVLAYALEVLILPSDWMRQVLRWVRCKTQPKNKYKHVLKEINEDVGWPPVTSV